ncbi:MAG: helix-turn-helix transcriptional regulator [Pseudoramibacter sp.]|jgi:DNA-binding XRE family transcriptional regulator
MNKLKQIRLKLNLTQDQMADMMNSDKFKVTQKDISRIERDENHPTYNFMKAFKRTFPEYKIEDVFFYDV